MTKKMIEEFAEGRNAQAAQDAELKDVLRPKPETTDVDNYYNSQKSIW